MCDYRGMCNSLKNTDHLSLAEFCVLADEEICQGHSIEIESSNAFYSVYNVTKSMDLAMLHQQHKVSKSLALVLSTLNGSELLRAKIAHNLI